MPLDADDEAMVGHFDGFDDAVRGGGGDFQPFARVFHDVINLDKAEGISQAECQAFRDMLEVSGITFK